MERVSCCVEMTLIMYCEDGTVKLVFADFSYDSDLPKQVDIRLYPMGDEPIEWSVGVQRIIDAYENPINILGGDAPLLKNTAFAKIVYHSDQKTEIALYAICDDILRLMLESGISAGSKIQDRIDKELDELSKGL